MTRKTLPALPPGKHIATTTEIAEVTIAALGHRGDGVAELAGRRVHVPFALPGERVRIEVAGERGRVLDLLEPAPERIAPACPHFGHCGGCALQHLAPASYARFTRDSVVAALRQRGFADPPVRDPIMVPPATRRRATLSALRGREGVILGFAARASHALVDLRACPVLVPELVALLAPLRDLLADLLPPSGRARLHLTATETGADIALDAARPLDLAARERLAAFAHGQDVARITWDGEVVVVRATPLVRFDGIALALPPGAFLQASAAGEAALRRLVAEGVGAAKRVVDLYAGCGTFSLPLARRARVHAVEGDGAALSALAAATRHAPDLKPVTTERRDLAARPLTPQELAGTEAVVFDPPRIGAKAQAEALARSSVPRVIGVSCNPASFARDARALVAGGYRLIEVTPVDQFLWSPHIELVGRFERD